MEKVTDLRRKVKERLTKKGVVDLSTFKLKPIDIQKDSETVSKSFSSSMKKIGQGLISNILISEISEDDKIKEIEKLFSDGIFNVDINVTTSSLVKSLIKAFNNNIFVAETSLEVEVNMDDSYLHCFTSLDYEPKLRHEGFIGFKNRPSEKISFISLNKLVGTIYFYNNLRNYIDTNKQMAKVLLLRFINNQGVYLSRNHYDEVASSLKDYGYPAEVKIRAILDEERSNISYNNLLRGGTYSYLTWDNPEEYYKCFDDIFGEPRYTDRKIPTVIKFPELSAYYFNHLYELNQEEEDDVKEEISIASEYARSYETKKNIPDKVLAKMKDNKFKLHFGYVEFDESVDLEMVELIEKEWEEINTRIKFPLAKDHSLRFRRLGKYKASGLYFPSTKAVCIDMQGPSSMIHEVLHMVDFTTLSSNLSSVFNFRSIIERYRFITDKNVNELPNNNGFKVMWNGKTKYSKSYYQSAKEIFARCGEIYITKFLKIESSLVKSDNPLIYPSDEFLLELIEKYYSSIIQVVDVKKEEDTTKVASKSYGVVDIEVVKKILKVNQISIFDLAGIS